MQTRLGPIVLLIVLLARAGAGASGIVKISTKKRGTLSPSQLEVRKLTRKLPPTLFGLVDFAHDYIRRTGGDFSSFVSVLDASLAQLSNARGIAPVVVDRKLLAEIFLLAEMLHKGPDWTKARNAMLVLEKAGKDHPIVSLADTLYRTHKVSLVPPHLVKVPPVVPHLPPQETFYVKTNISDPNKMDLWQATKRLGNVDLTTGRMAISDRNPKIRFLRQTQGNVFFLVVTEDGKKKMQLRVKRPEGGGDPTAVETVLPTEGGQILLLNGYPQIRHQRQRDAETTEFVALTDKIGAGNKVDHLHGKRTVYYERKSNDGLARGMSLVDGVEAKQTKVQQFEFVEQPSGSLVFHSLRNDGTVGSLLLRENKATINPFPLYIGLGKLAVLEGKKMQFKEAPELGLVDSSKMERLLQQFQEWGVRHELARQRIRQLSEVLGTQ